MDYTTKQSCTLEEVADMLFSVSYNLLATQDTKCIDFVILIKKNNDDYIGNLTIRYGLRDEQKDLYFEHWEQQVTEIVNSTQGKNEGSIVSELEKRLISNMNVILDMYFLNLDLISEEEREYILTDHIVSTNLFANAFMKKSNGMDLFANSPTLIEQN
ncbi:hypothetical protein ABD87_14890 [Lysinibacillus sphaericus]|uniref:hypothetical protein n=1 Tax=Lysinibacillus sphaericus TaxID=1421 RepID=UPI0018CCCF51|nr:hypothetical protein [Lysinibacillus sphaericus]MBG9730780.1 hypothetical protein [Lysinibacillus sphaericus]